MQHKQLNGALCHFAPSATFCHSVIAGNSNGVRSAGSLSILCLSDKSFIVFILFCILYFNFILFVCIRPLNFIYVVIITSAVLFFFIAQRELCCFTSYCFDTCKSFQCCNLGVSSVGNRRIYAYLLILAYLPNKTYIYIYTYCVFFIFVN